MAIPTEKELRQKLSTDLRWIERAVLAIYERQTQSEQSQEMTIERNDVGFGAFDAITGSAMARWLQKGNHLSGKYIEKAKKMMPKYAKQLLDIARENEAKKQPTLTGEKS